MVLARVRTYNSERPAQSVELPVVRLANILALNPDQMIFLIRSQTARTNLLLANVSDPNRAPGQEVTLRIELFSADGQQLVSQSTMILPARQIYIVDIGSYFGVANPSVSQVRVTRIAGSGVFWGILPSVSADGTISIAQGQVP